MEIPIKRLAVHALFSLVFLPDRAKAHMYIGMHESLEAAKLQLEKVIQLDYGCRYEIIHWHSLPVEDIMLSVDYTSRFSNLMRKIIEEKSFKKPVQMFLNPCEILYINSKIHGKSKQAICSTSREGEL